MQKDHCGSAQVDLAMDQYLLLFQTYKCFRDRHEVFFFRRLEGDRNVYELNALSF